MYHYYCPVSCVRVRYAVSGQMPVLAESRSLVLTDGESGKRQPGNQTLRRLQLTMM
jgi:hypothetical protein